MLKISIPYHITQMIGKTSSAETEKADCILIKLKTCFCLKSKFKKNNLSNIHMC